MNPKPNPHISEPDAGYAEVAERAVTANAPPLTPEQQGFLREALVDFEELEEEAKEEGLPAPAPTAKKAAFDFLHSAIREAPRPYAVSMWGKGTVIVYTQSKRGYRADIFFDADGSASCLILRPKDEGRENRHYPQAAKVANELVFDTLRQMRG